MRSLVLPLIACCCVVTAASGASDPLISPSMKSAWAARRAGSSSAGASSSGPARKLSQREQEAQAEADLSAKIQERLAIMRANQAARVAAAAKAKKEAAAKAAKEAAKPKVYSNVWSYEGERPGQLGHHQSGVGQVRHRQPPVADRYPRRHEGGAGTDRLRLPSILVQRDGQRQDGAGDGRRRQFLNVNNRMYELVQFHFHRPSEERINGKGYEMVVHLVHKDAEGHIAMLALLLERGKPQPVIQTVWNNLPLEKYDTAAPSTVLDPMELLPARRDYFTFMGSMTTPPCQEGVLWMVMKEPVQASPQQMALFSRCIR
jgi:carbonic anhydrase